MYIKTYNIYIYIQKEQNIYRQLTSQDYDLTSVLWAKLPIWETATPDSMSRSLGSAPQPFPFQPCSNTTVDS